MAANGLLLQLTKLSWSTTTVADFHRAAWKMRNQSTAD